MTKLSSLQGLTFLTKKSVLYVAPLFPVFASVFYLILLKFLPVFYIPKELIRVILVMFLVLTIICNNCNKLSCF